MKTAIVKSHNYAGPVGGTDHGRAERPRWASRPAQLVVGSQGPAAKPASRLGDVITDVNGHGANSEEDVTAAVDMCKDCLLGVTYLRGGRSYYVRVRVQ